LLRQHAARHYQIGPEDIRIVERLGVPVDEPELPRLGQERGKRD
jgi:hypothetical protein